MSCALTSGRREISCRNNIGGLKNIYLFKYDAYNIVLSGQEVVTFPDIGLFKYEIRVGDFKQSIENDENGIVYSQDLNFTLFKQDLLTSLELNRATNIDLMYIVEFNDGTYRLGGLRNGASITSLELVSGGSKGELNGYNITISGKELLEAPFIDADTFLELSFLLLEDDFNLLLEDDFKIIL